MTNIHHIHRQSKNKNEILKVVRIKQTQMLINAYTHIHWMSLDSRISKKVFKTYHFTYTIQNILPLFFKKEV